MAVTLTGTTVYSVDGFTGVATFSSGSQSFTSGRYVWVAAFGQEYWHTDNFSWAISDDASSNDPTWTDMGTSSLDSTEAANLSTQVQVWRSDALTANESFTITVDPNDGSSNTYLGAMLVWETAGGDGTLEQSIVFDVANSTSSNTINYGSSPSLTQAVACFANGPNATSDWDAAPSNWSKVSGCEADGDTGNGLGYQALLIDSTTNTSTGVTQSISGAGTVGTFWMVALEFAEGGKTGSAALTAAVAVSGTGQRHRYASAALSAAVAVSGTGTKGASGSAALTAAVAVSATGAKHVNHTGSAALSAAVSVSAGGGSHKSGAAALAANFAVSASGRRETGGSITAAVSLAGIGYNHTLDVTETPTGGITVAGSPTVTFTEVDAHVDSDIKLLWDLDNDGDFSEPAEDITSYMTDLQVVRGRDFPSQLTGRSTPGTLRATLVNLDSRFSYFNGSSPLNTAPFSLKSGRKVRVQTNGATSPDPTRLARDRFGGSGSLGDDEEGNTWTVSGGTTWTRADGAITADTTTGWATIDPGSQSTVYAQATFRYLDADNFAGIVYRFTDTSNYGYVYLDVANHLLGHKTTLSGSPTTHTTTSVEVVRGHVTIGVEINSDDDVTVYLEGVPMFTDAGDGGTGAVGSGTSYGVLCTHNNHRHPAPEDFGLWDGLWQDTSGMLFTGDLTKILPSSHIGGAHTTQIEAQGWLSRLAGPEITPPTSIGVTGESPAGVTAGVMVGATLQRAGMLHPPPPGGLDAGALTLGGVGTGNAKALTVARKFEATESGFLYETPHGPVSFADSTARDSASPVASFSDSQLDQYRYTSIDLLSWRREVFNRVSAEVSPHVPFFDNFAAAGSNQSAGYTMDVKVALPTSATGSAGDLLLLCIIAPCQLPGEPFVTPAGWTALNDPGDALGRQHWFAKILTSTDLGTLEKFYQASGPGGGTWIYRWVTINNWYGSIEEGVDISDPTGSGDATISDAQAGTHDVPVLLPRWGRQPTFFLASRSGAYTSSSASVSFTSPDDIPDGWLNGASNAELAATVSTDDLALQWAWKHDVAAVESPTDFGGTFTGFDYLECYTVAVRGYAGDPPESSGGEIVTVEDLDSQAEHNLIGSYPAAGQFFADTTDADTFCDSVLATYADERPLFRLGFHATTASARYQAYNLKLGDMIRVVASGASGMGVNDLFFIEQITHRWDRDSSNWWVELAVSPQ